MKTLDEVFTLENLYATHKRCRVGKQHKREVIQFELNLYKNLNSIRQSILNKTYKISHYRKFKIYEPKERSIESLSYYHRIIQNCLCKYLLKPTLERYLIYDNSACRENKGTDFARKRLEKFLINFSNEHSNGYVLKCDISKYFASIDKAILRKKLKKIFNDEIMWLLDIYIESIKTSNGVPIGNQTSQWFALLYLNDMDHIIKEKYKIKYYTRYMDDFIILHQSKSYLKEILLFLKNTLKKEKLSLNNKTCIYNIKKGICYLGFTYYLCDNSKVIMKQKQEACDRLKRAIIKHMEKYSIMLKPFMDYLSLLSNYNSYLRKLSLNHQKNMMKLK